MAGHVLAPIASGAGYRPIPTALSRARLRRSRITAVIPEPSDQIAHREGHRRGARRRAGHRPSMPRITRAATSLNETSTTSSNGADWPPATTNSPSTPAQPRSYAPSPSGYPIYQTRPSRPRTQSALRRISCRGVRRQRWLGQQLAALVLGVSATGVSTHTLLATGMAGLLAGALSMGAGEYVSVRSPSANCSKPRHRTRIPVLRFPSWMLKPTSSRWCTARVE